MIGYCRVSTEEQSLNLQIDALQRAGCTQIFKDVGISGAARERQGLSDALRALTSGDVLVTWRLDRLGRSLGHLIQMVSDLNEQGCEFKSLTEALDTTTPGGRLVFHVMGALAEFERELISTRTKAGLEAAKRRGQHIGRPFKLSPQQVQHAREMTEGGTKSTAEMARLYGVNRSTLWRALRNQRVGSSD